MKNCDYSEGLRNEKGDYDAASTIDPEVVLGNLYDLFLKSGKKDKVEGKRLIKILLYGDFSMGNGLIILDQFHPEVRDEIAKNMDLFNEYYCYRCKQKGF